MRLAVPTAVVLATLALTAPARAQALRVDWDSCLGAGAPTPPAQIDGCTDVIQSARQDGFSATDEASMVERLDVEVTVVPGSDRNIKITKPTDMDLAHLFFREQHKEAR